MVLDGKSSQEYLLASVPQESIVGSTLFLLYAIMNFLMLSEILLSMLMMLFST